MCVGQGWCENVFVALPPPLSQSWKCSKTGPFSAGWQSWAWETAWQIAEFMTLPWHTNSPSEVPGFSNHVWCPAKFKNMFSSCSCRKRVLICPLYCVSSWLPEDMRESTILKWWSNTWSWGICPRCAARVAVLSACPFLIWWWMVCLPRGSSSYSNRPIRMPGGCGSFQLMQPVLWCRVLSGWAQGALSLPALCLIKGKFIWNSNYADNWRTFIVPLTSPVSV